MKIAIVVGHNIRARGAVSVDGTSEFVWNSDLAEMIREHDLNAVRVFTRRRGGGYSAEIDRVYSEVDAWGADVSAELHFNGSSSANACGVLTLSSGSKGSLALAEQVHAKCLAVMERPDRGVEVRGRHDRGGRSLWQGRAPAIMTEPFFGSNPEDWRRANARKEYLAEAIFRGCCAYLQTKLRLAA